MNRPAVASMPGAALHDASLAPSTKAVLMAMCSETTDGECRLSPSVLAAVLPPMTADDIRRELDRLEASGWISDLREKGKAGPQWSINLSRTYQKRIKRAKPTFDADNFSAKNREIYPIFAEMEKAGLTGDGDLQRMMGSPWQRKAAERLLALHGLHEVNRVISVIGQGSGEKYCPKVRSVTELESKWEKVISYSERGGSIGVI